MNAGILNNLSIHSYLFIKHNLNLALHRGLTFVRITQIMDLIERSDLLNANSNGSFTMNGLSNILMNTLKLNKVNKLYSQNVDKRNHDFLEAILQELEIRHEINPYELSQIPAEGAFITVSNHPFGGIDGLLLLKLMSMARSDFKVFGNYLLQKISPLEEYVIPVNPFENRKSISSGVSGLIQARNHLSAGHPIGIFPAGEVSSINGRMVKDRQWIGTAIKFINKANVPVIPIYFHGYNSNLFYLLGLINPMLRTAKLPSELFNKKNKTLTIRVGSPISVQEQNEFEDINQFSRFLRAKTYALGSPLEVKKFFQFRLRKVERQEVVAAEGNTLEVENEIENLPSSCHLFTSGDYSVYCSQPTEIPYTLNEIGRLREITFREVGEGTNNSLDLDEFDLYYEHLFLWDNREKKIAGAYRVGKGKEIMNYFGKKGFYVSTLFNISKEFLPVMDRSIELGRSFVIKQYQKKPACLFLLWKGILSVLLKNPEYRYLLGPVSISNAYSNLSKGLIVDFIKSHYFQHKYASYISPKKEFKAEFKKVDHLVMLDYIKNDINKLDKMIEEIEPSHYKMPVLFKKYLKQNARILGFNVDPRFNKALDGLMLLDLFEVPLETLKSLSKELNDESIMQRFYAQHAVDEYTNAPQL